MLALIDSGSFLRGPFALFFLFASPAAAIAVALRGLDPFGRFLTSVAGAVVVDMLVAQGMLAAHRWSVESGIIAVAVISVLIPLPILVRHMHRRTTADKFP
ncbi:hypothetical protein [Streptomyces sp. NPDC005423]|uniref:hypothetical protein n=1 Tax=Streptomyces sp. NPDC005423 TaxID=3155343 RepID=UPI00339E35B0